MAKPNRIQSEINQMYRKLLKRGALLSTKTDEEDGTITEEWALLEHCYRATKDPGAMPHIFHCYTTGTTFCSE